MADAGGKNASLYELIGEHCTAEQIRNVLRQFKEHAPKAVMVSGTKDDAINHLRSAIDQHAIPIHEAHALLREAEENGRQHILYYKPRSEAVANRLRNFERVKKALFGDDFDSYKFPRYLRKPNKYEWADFRAGPPTKQTDWRAKLYGFEIQYEYRDEDILEDGTLAKYFAKKEHRTICLVRWNEPDLLEIRIDSAGINKKVLGKRLDTVLEFIQPLVSLTDLIEWDLHKVRDKLAATRATNDKLYRLGSLELRDSQSGKVTFAVSTDEEGADDAPERAEALDALIKGHARCSFCVASWLIELAKGMLAAELRTACSPNRVNEVAITARCPSLAVEYVTNQLRKFD